MPNRNFAGAYKRKKKETPVICFQLFFTPSPYCIVPSFALPWKMRFGESRLTCTHNIISIQNIHSSVKEIRLYNWDIQGTSYPPEEDKVYEQRLL